MHAVVIGAGRLGRTLAAWLVDAGHEVSVLDESASRRAMLDDALGSVSVAGRGISREALQRAGANRADAVIATLERDSVNLVACQIAKMSFNVPLAIAVVNSADNADLFRRLGVDHVVDASEAVLGRIREGLASHGVARVRTLNTDGVERSIVSIRVPNSFGTEGRRLDAFPFPDGATPALVITRGGDPHPADDSMRVRAGDEILAVATAEGEDRLRSLLAAEDPWQRQ